MNYLATGYSSTYQKQINEVKEFLLRMIETMEEKLKIGMKAMEMF